MGAFPVTKNPWLNFQKNPVTIGKASTRISVFFRAISVPFNFLSKFPAQWFAQPRSQGLSFLPSAGETRRETLGTRLWFPLRNIGNFRTRNLFQEISVPEFMVEWKAPSVLGENYFIIDGDILSFIVFACFFTYSVKRFFFTVGKDIVLLNRNFVYLLSKNWVSVI